MKNRQAVLQGVSTRPAQQDSTDVVTDLMATTDVMATTDLMATNTDLAPTTSAEAVVIPSGGVSCVSHDLL